MSRGLFTRFLLIVFVFITTNAFAIHAAEARGNRMRQRAAQDAAPAKTVAKRPVLQDRAPVQSEDAADSGDEEAAPAQERTGRRTAGARQSQNGADDSGDEESENESGEESGEEESDDGADEGDDEGDEESDDEGDDESGDEGDEASEDEGDDEGRGGCNEESSVDDIDAAISQSVRSARGR